MTIDTQTRQVVSAFLAARSAGDMQTAALYLAPEFTFQSPMMRLEDPAAYLASHRDFARVLTGIDMISELYGEGEGRSSTTSTQRRPPAPSARPSTSDWPATRSRRSC